MATLDDENSYGLGSWWDGIGGDYITVDTSAIDNRTNKDNQATMTDSEYLKSLATAGTTAETWYGQATYSALYFGKSVLEAIQAPFDSAKESLAGVADTASELTKLVLRVAIVAGVVGGGYLAINMLATTKRNVRTLKASKASNE
jgi:hypothetical protein